MAVPRKFETPTGSCHFVCVLHPSEGRVSYEQRHYRPGVLLPVSKDCGDGARAATSMQHCDNPQGLFIRRIGDQVFTNNDEAQGARCQVWAFVALMRKSHQSTDSFKHFLAKTPSPLRTILRDERPYFCNVLGRKGVKVKTPRHGYSFLRTSSSFWRRLSKNASPSMGFTLPLLRSS
jgi:hypothetical protein